MNSAKRNFLLGLVKLFNLGLMMVSFGLAMIMVAETTAIAPWDFLSMRVKLSNFIIFSAVLWVWHVIFSLCGLYESRRLSGTGYLIVEAAKATTLASIFLAVVAALFQIKLATPAFLLFFWALSTTLIVGSRLAIRFFLGSVRRHGRNLRYVLVLGTNPRAVEFARKIESAPGLGYRVLGFVDDKWVGTSEFLQTGSKLCCNLDGLAEFLRSNVIDEVALYLPLRSFHAHTSEIAALCEQHGIILRFDSDIFNLKIARSRLEELDGEPHVTAYAGAPGGWPMLVKRCIDIVGSFTLLALLSPLLALVALLIKLTSEGPVFFLQERVGLNKRRFLIYKFRTMVPNAEQLLPELEAMNEVAGPVFKIKNDPRMTPIGKWLRRASADELPQLFNVLKGDMSLVGPRPLPVRDYEGFSEDWQRRRFSIRPGITCLWQVGGRNSITFERWMKLDIEYLDQWSLWLDLKILARTIPAVMKGSGAA